MYKRQGYGDAVGAGLEPGLDEPADFMAAEPGGVRSEDDRDEARIAAPHGGNDIVAGSRDPAAAPISLQELRFPSDIFSAHPSIPAAL